MMKQLALFFLLISGLALLTEVQASAQAIVTTDDPRELALDIFGDVNRESPPATIAARLQSLVRVFRFRCTRLTDYQIFAQRPNIIDFKVKCSGDPLYGVTVASNGYVAVYGGNGILSGLNRSDALIYSFDTEGEFAYNSALTVNQALEETVSRIDFEDEVNAFSAFGIVAIVAAFILILAIVWWRAWKYKQTRKPRQRMKPMAKHRVGAASATKNALLEESRQIGKNVYRHPQGFYIARGKHGKRRFFDSFIWAQLYASMGLRLFETSLPRTVTDEEA